MATRAPRRPTGLHPVAAGVLSGAGWATAGAWMPGVALLLEALAGGAWWASRRRGGGCAGGVHCACGTT